MGLAALFPLSLSAFVRQLSGAQLSLYSASACQLQRRCYAPTGCPRPPKRSQPCLMCPTKVNPNVVSYNAAMSACEKCSQWQLALHLLGLLPAASWLKSTMVFSVRLDQPEVLEACRGESPTNSGFIQLGEQRFRKVRRRLFF